MDNNRTFQELKDAIGAFVAERDWDQFHHPKDLAAHIVIEAAELLDLFRYKTPEEQKEVLTKRREEIEDEVADVLILIAEFARKTDIDLATAYEKKLKKSGEKYPVHRARGDNRKSTEF